MAHLMNAAAEPSGEDPVYQPKVCSLRLSACNLMVPDAATSLVVVKSLISNLSGELSEKLTAPYGLTYLVNKLERMYLQAKIVANVK